MFRDAGSASGTKIRLSSVFDFSESRRTLKSFHLLVQSREFQLMARSYLFSASGCFEIIQDDQVIPLGTRVYDHLELCIEAPSVENSITPVRAYTETRELSFNV